MPPSLPSGFGVSGGDVEFTFTGIAEGNLAMANLHARSPAAMRAALLELGLLLEHNIKPHVRVRTGRLRASIGHFTPSDLTGEASTKDAAEAARNAYFDPPTVDDLAVSVGTRLNYGPMVNYKLGDLFMEKGLQETINAIPTIVLQYLQAING